MAEAENKTEESSKLAEEGANEDDELGLKKLAREITDTNKKIDDAYEEKLRRLEVKRKLLPDEKEEEMHLAMIGSLNEKLRELKNRISDARRSGKDPFIADLVLRNAGAKIKMAQVTHDKRDVEEVEKILNRAESELQEALKEEELNVKKEVEARLRQGIAKQTGKVDAD